MASWKNAEKSARRAHKERSQPQKRRRFGLLEKHQDYVKRARDYNRKKKKIQNLRVKAANKNPDEFNFGMVNAQLKDGVHEAKNPYDSDSDGMDEDVRKLVRTQDLSYAHMINAIESKRIKKLQDGLHFLSASLPNKHTLFLDNEEEVQAFSAADYFKTTEEMSKCAYNRLTLKQLQEQDIAGPDPKTDRRLTQKLGTRRRKAYAELMLRQKRLEKIHNLRAHLQQQKNVAQKGRRVCVAKARDGQPAVFKWAKDRKR